MVLSGYPSLSSAFIDMLSKRECLKQASIVCEGADQYINAFNLLILLISYNILAKKLYLPNHDMIL